MSASPNSGRIAARHKLLLRGPIREVAWGLNLDHQHRQDDIEALGKTVAVCNCLAHHELSDQRMIHEPGAREGLGRTKPNAREQTDQIVETLAIHRP